MARSQQTNSHVLSANELPASRRRAILSSSGSYRKRHPARFRNTWSGCCAAERQRPRFMAVGDSQLLPIVRKWTQSGRREALGERLSIVGSAPTKICPERDRSARDREA